MLAARLYDKKGKGKFYNKTDPEGEDHRVDMGNYMTQTRFKEIKYYIKYIFEDETQKIMIHGGSSVKQ